MNLSIETKLIDKATAGDEAAFTEIYTALRNPIYGFVFRMLRNTELAEDITQEAFIFFIEQPQKYQSERGTLLAFLCGYARNRILNRLRQDKNRLQGFQDITADEIEIQDEAAPSPLNILLAGELSEKIEESLAKLPALQREVLLLRGMNELSYEEIGRIVEADTTVVKMRLYRARRSLIELLAPYTATERKSNHEVR